MATLRELPEQETHLLSSPSEWFEAGPEDANASRALRRLPPRPAAEPAVTRTRTIRLTFVAVPWTGEPAEPDTDDPPSVDAMIAWQRQFEASIPADFVTLGGEE